MEIRNIMSRLDLIDERIDSEIIVTFHGFSRYKL